LNRRPADYESPGSSSMPCDVVISWLLGQPMPSTRDTASNEKHSCWLSAWLSTSRNRWDSVSDSSRSTSEVPAGTRIHFEWRSLKRKFHVRLGTPPAFPSLVLRCSRGRRLNGLTAVASGLVSTARPHHRALSRSPSSPCRSSYAVSRSRRQTPGWR
jgi:hypothetical protein